MIVDHSLNGGDGVVFVECDVCRVGIEECIAENMSGGLSEYGILGIVVCEITNDVPD